MEVGSPFKQDALWLYEETRTQHIFTPGLCVNFTATLCCSWEIRNLLRCCVQGCHGVYKKRGHDSTWHHFVYMCSNPFKRLHKYLLGIVQANCVVSGVSCSSHSKFLWCYMVILVVVLVVVAVVFIPFCLFWMFKDQSEPKFTPALRFTCSINSPSSKLTANCSSNDETDRQQHNTRSHLPAQW